MSARYTRRRARTAALTATALAAWAVLGIAPSSASPSPSPEPSPAPTPSTNVQAENPDWEAPETVDTYVGQSVQSRRSADGVQNAGINFRWAVTQVNAETLNNLDVSIPVPMDDTPGLRSLTGSSNMPETTDGGVLFDFDEVEGIQTKRVLNLWPQDRPLPVDIRTEFTLNGEPVQAQQIVGEGGLVTAKYTIVNNSVTTAPVEFDNVKGEADTKEVETSQAFVGISKQFIPQSWAQFDPGHGIFGADGRGNFQTQWITLAFLPFAEGGEASFGWSAVIPEGEGFIPKMVIEVSPLYVPPHAAEEEEEGAESSNGVPKPNLDDASASVHSGIEDLIAGVTSLAETIGTTGDITREGVQIAIADVKEAVEVLCSEEYLYCDDPDPVSLGEIKAGLTTAIETVEGIIKTLQEEIPGTGGTVGEINEQLRQAKSKVDRSVDELETIDDVLAQGVFDNSCPGAGEPVYCEPLVTAHEGVGEQIPVLESASAQIDAAIDLVTTIGEGLSTDGLEQIKTQLETTLALVTGVETALNNLKPPLAQLSSAVASIGAAIDTGLSNLAGVGASLDQISSGKAQVSAGIGMASAEVGAYIADVVAVAKAAAESGKDVAAEIEAHANTIKAQLAGLKGRMAESPLPYGGGMNTVYAPAGDAEAVQTEATSIVSETGTVTAEGVQPTTELFGAYQFMLDPADTNKPYTIWRIVLAFVLVIGAGLIGMMVSRRTATAT